MSTSRLGCVSSAGPPAAAADSEGASASIAACTNTCRALMTCCQTASTGRMGNRPSSAVTAFSMAPAPPLPPTRFRTQWDNIASCDSVLRPACRCCAAAVCCSTTVGRRCQPLISLHHSANLLLLMQQCARFECSLQHCNIRQQARDNVSKLQSDWAFCLQPKPAPTF